MLLYVTHNPLWWRGFKKETKQEISASATEGEAKERKRRTLAPRDKNDRWVHHPEDPSRIIERREGEKEQKTAKHRQEVKKGFLWTEGLPSRSQAALMVRTPS
jgi:hypothetical protein